MNNPEDVQQRIKEIEPYLSYAGEVQFIDGSYSVSGGTWIKFYCSEKEALDKFEGKGKHSKTKEGQRYILMLVEIQDDETPINQSNKRRIEKEELLKGGPISKRAGILCHDKDYLLFLKAGKHIQDGDKNMMVFQAEEYVRAQCGVASRRTLDHDREAAHRFRTVVLEPYLKWYSGS